MTFAEKFYSLRKEAGLSQEECAENIGVSRQAISRWEMGTATPDMQNLLAISKLFSVSTDYLIRDDDIDNRSADTETSSSDYLIRDEIDDKKADIPKSSPEETAAHEKKKTYSAVKNTIINILIKLPSFLLPFLAAKQIPSSQGIFLISIIFAVLFMYDFFIGTLNFRPEHNKINDTARKNFFRKPHRIYRHFFYHLDCVYRSARIYQNKYSSLYFLCYTVSVFFKSNHLYTKLYTKRRNSFVSRKRDIFFDLVYFISRIVIHSISCTENIRSFLADIRVCRSDFYIHRRVPYSHSCLCKICKSP